jgi:cell division septum initiation protein DivIVA
MTPLTPGQIESTDLPLALRGYDREETHRFLKKIAAGYEEVWAERKALREEIERLREREALVAEAFVAAERAADEIRAQARREGETILDEARAHAEEMVRAAVEERGELERTLSSLRTVVDRVRSEVSALVTDMLDQLGPEDASHEAMEDSVMQGKLSVIEDRSTGKTSIRE